LSRSNHEGDTGTSVRQNIKKTAILAVMLLLAALPAFCASGLHIVRIQASGLFQLSDYRWWSPLNRRDIKNWKVGDGITAVRSASCGNDPNVYLLTDVDQLESACAQRIGR